MSIDWDIQGAVRAHPFLLRDLLAQRFFLSVTLWEAKDDVIFALLAFTH